MDYLLADLIRWHSQQGLAVPIELWPQGGRRYPGKKFIVIRERREGHP